MSQVTAYIGLGSNLPGSMASPQAQLVAAMRAFDGIESTGCIARSSLYRSTPLPVEGGGEQPDYINAVACLVTGLTAEALLDALQAIEQSQGRERGVRWAARTLDLDILLYGDLQRCDARLTIPHPELCEREFTVIPLLEIAPDVIIPSRGKLSAIARSLPGNGLERIVEQL